MHCRGACKRFALVMKRCVRISNPDSGVVLDSEILWEGWQPPQTGGLAITCAWKQGVKVTDEPNKTGRSYSQRKAHSRNHDEIPKRRYLKSFMWYSQSFPHEHRDRNHCFLDGRLLSITVPVEKTCSHFRIKAHTLTKSVELFWRFTRWKVARRSRLRKTICKKAEHFTISTTMLP